MADYEYKSPVAEYGWFYWYTPPGDCWVRIAHYRQHGPKPRIIGGQFSRLLGCVALAITTEVFLHDCLENETND